MQRCILFQTDAKSSAYINRLPLVRTVALNTCLDFGIFCTNFVVGYFQLSVRNFCSPSSLTHNAAVRHNTAAAADDDDDDEDDDDDNCTRCAAGG